LNTQRSWFLWVLRLTGSGNSDKSGTWLVLQRQPCPSPLSALSAHVSRG